MKEIKLDNLKTFKATLTRPDGTKFIFLFPGKSLIDAHIQLFNLFCHKASLENIEESKEEL